jgi:predicted dehydrogenase
MDSILRVCVVGAGDMGLRHLKAWQNVEQVEVVALVEGVEERLAQAGQECGISGLYQDYKQAIDETRPAVVSVCLPTSFHAPVTIYALESGAHVLCEKPVALNLADAEAMKETARRKGLLLAVGFMLRYSPAVARLKEWLAAGKIGRPVMVVSENFMEVRPKRVMHAKNINGGPIADFWCHHFDLWAWLFESEPASVAGYGAVFAQNKPEVSGLGELAVDTATVSIKYRSGDIGQLSTSWGWPPALKPWAISSDKFIGPDGLIFGDIRKKLTLVQSDGQTEEVSNAGLNFWQDEIDAFARAIRQGGYFAGVDEGIAALKVSLAAFEAIEQASVD